MRKTKDLPLALGMVFTLPLYFKESLTMLSNSCKFYCKGGVSKSSGQCLVYSDIMMCHLTSYWGNVRDRNPGETLGSSFTARHY